MSWNAPEPSFGGYDCLQLINLVKQYPVLFTATKEMTLGLRRNRSEINRTWEVIAAELKISAFNCKRRWKSLKDVYAKIRKKRFEESILGVNPEKKWIYEDAMSFVKLSFERDYQQALEHYEDIDMKEWKMEESEENDIAEEMLDEVVEGDGIKAEQQLDQNEDDQAEYLDLDLEVDAIPDSEEYCSKKGQRVEKRSSGNETSSERSQTQSSLLKSNCNATGVKLRPKYRPIRPKPYQSTLLDKNRANSISSIINVSNLGAAGNSFIVTNSLPKKGKYDTVILTSPMKLRGHSKGFNGASSNDETPPAKKNAEKIVDATATGKKDSRANKSQGKNGNKGSIELFFESMAQTVQSLPMHVQAEIKMEICKLVTMAEIKYSSTPSKRFNKRS